MQLSSSPIIKKHKKTMMDDDFIGKEKTPTTTISDLLEEVLTDVLVRLSLKDILPCLGVQKSWHSLIKSRMFINLYSTYRQQISSSSNPNNNKYLIFWNTHTKAYEIRVDDIQCEKYLALKYPLKLFGRYNFHLVSNGLFCLFNLRVHMTHQDIYLWNPVIQKYITLPPSPHPPYSCGKAWWTAVAFGFIPQINDYVVVYMVKYGSKDKPRSRTHYIINCVYNLSTNSWKQITHNNTDIRRICIPEGIIVNGIVIWFGYDSHMDKFLVCFDTKTEMLRKISSPKSLKSPPVIRAFDQSIVYFVVKRKDSNEHDMWILKGDPMNDFVWEMKRVIGVEAFVRVLGLRNNGELILQNSFDLISYDFDSHKSYDLVKSWDKWTPFCLWDDGHLRPPLMIKPFAESLGLLDI